MNRKQVLKLVHEGQYAAEVKVELIYNDDGWSPYLSLDDALRLDEARSALRRGDLALAAQLGRVYELVPLAA
jgi:hypothetical protein